MALLSENNRRGMLNSDSLDCPAIRCSWAEMFPTDNSPPLCKTNIEISSYDHDNEKTDTRPQLSQIIKIMAGSMANANRWILWFWQRLGESCENVEEIQRLSTQKHDKTIAKNLYRDGACYYIYSYGTRCLGSSRSLTCLALSRIIWGSPPRRERGRPPYQICRNATCVRWKRQRWLWQENAMLNCLGWDWGDGGRRGKCWQAQWEGSNASILNISTAMAMRWIVSLYFVVMFWFAPWIRASI